MKQTVHIFRKDVHHLLPELGVYVAVLIAYGWAEPFTWHSGLNLHSPEAGVAGLLLIIIRPLIPLLWFVTISRLIHDESLVGDRQLWLTRPYNRISLATAKILFACVCIALPFAMMQAYLIMHAGLGVRHAIPDMFFNLRTLSLDCWLPFIALATVTPSLVRMLLSAIGTLLAFFYFTLFITLNLLITQAPPPFLDTTMATLFALLVLGAIIFQYITRYTMASRVLLLVAFAIVGILRIVAPANLLFKLRYPLAPRWVSFDSSRRPNSTESHLNPLHGQYGLTLPIQGNIQEPTVYGEVASSYTIDTPSLHYASGWKRAALNPNSVSMYISPETLARFSGSPSNLHVSVVATKLQSVGISSSDGLIPFQVPGNGDCLTDRNGASSTLNCQYAFASPPIVLLETSSTGSGKEHVLQAKVASPSFDPIAEIGMALQTPPQLPTHFSVITYQPAERVNIALDARGVNLAQDLTSGLQ